MSKRARLHRALMGLGCSRRQRWSSPTEATLGDGRRASLDLRRYSQQLTVTGKKTMIQYGFERSAYLNIYMDRGGYIYLCTDPGW